MAGTTKKKEEQVREAEDGNSPPADLSDWDTCEDLVPPCTPSTSPPRAPSYAFAGTWTAAYHDTATAVAQVGSASKSYVSALTKSGIGKAGWSIGSALLTSTGKGASSLTGWAFNRAGIMPNDLPGPMRSWLQRKHQRAGRPNIPPRGSQMYEPGADQPGPFFLQDEREGFMVEAYQLGKGDEIVRALPREINDETMREARGWQRTPVSYSPPPARIRPQLEDDVAEKSHVIADDSDDDDGGQGTMSGLENDDRGL
ncbi:hypothetical protein ACN47E_005778 [Coniothyrium glycines]